MKKILMITLFFSASAWANGIQLDPNAQTSCPDSKLLTSNIASCCDAHKGTCGCSRAGNVCCDGAVMRGCECEDPSPKKK